MWVQCWPLSVLRKIPPHSLAAKTRVGFERSTAMPLTRPPDAPFGLEASRVEVSGLMSVTATLSWAAAWWATRQHEANRTSVLGFIADLRLSARLARVGRARQRTVRSC